MEASIFFTRGCEKDSHVDVEGAAQDFTKALHLVPRNGLIADKPAWTLNNEDHRAEASSLWARAAVFGKGQTAKDARFQLHQWLVPDKVEQTIREAAKIP